MNEGNNDLILKKKFMKQIKIVSKYITIKKKTSNYRFNNSKHR